MYIYTNMDTNKRGKLFIPRKLDERLKIWNESQPIIDGERINQYDLETGEFTGRWGQGEIDGGNTIDLFKIHYDIFFSGNLEQEDFEHLSKVENRGEGVKYLTDIIKADLIETLDENGPLGRAHFDLTISLNDKRIRDVFDSLVDKEISDYYKKLNESEKKKLFIPRKLSKGDSRFDDHNNSQPIKNINGKDIRINQFDEDGRKQGYWEFYYDNGELMSKGNYKDDKEDGYWEEYYSDGVLMYKGNYKDDKRDGYWEWYYPNGELSSKGNYVNGFREGYWEYYWRNGNLESKGNYLNDSKDGYWEYYYPVGSLNRKGLFKDGKPIMGLKESEKKKLFIPRKLSKGDSRYDEWNKTQPIKDGVRINQYDYEGRKQGYWEEYDDGVLTKGSYVNGKMNGYWEEYYENGVLHYKGNFKNGLKDGYWEWYYSSGELYSKGNYVDGKAEGYWEEYYKDGGLMIKSNYVNGERVKNLNESEEEMGNKDRILKSFEVKKELNHKIWDDEDTLKPKIKSTLLAIGQEFYKTLDIDAPIDDIIFTGSLANYNWSEYSDVDLHVVIDFNEFDDKDLIKKYFDAKKVIWNDNHNIKIKGYDVELYAQDKNEEHESSGIYSIMNNEWIKKPNPKQVNIDRETIKKKVKEFEKEYNRIFSLFEKGEYQETKKSLDKIKDKIKKYRKAGLDKTGEMGTENLVFKTLRRSGLMEKIINLGIETTDKEYTIETFNESEKKKLFIPRKLSKSDHRWMDHNKSQPIKNINGENIRINQYDENGLKQGYWEEYYSNGEIMSKGSYVDNIRQGYWEFYYDNGSLNRKGNYINGEKDGYWEWYWENGQLEKKGSYVNGKRYGYWELYYRNGQLDSKGNYVEGNGEGYYSDGRLMFKGYYKNGGYIEDIKESEEPKNGNFLKDFKKNIGIDVSFLTSFGAGINGLIRNVSSLIKDYTVQPLNNFELINLAIAMIVVYLKKNKSIKDFKDELLSITAFTSLMPGYIDLVNSLVGNVDFMEAFMTLIKSIGVYSMLNHFKSK